MEEFFSDYQAPKAELQKCPTCGSNTLVDGVCQHCNSELKPPPEPGKFARGGKMWEMVRLAMAVDHELDQEEDADDIARTPSTESQTTCSRCGTSVPSQAKFCPECGNKTELSRKICSNCGSSAQSSARFCPNCGTSL